MISVQTQIMMQQAQRAEQKLAVATAKLIQFERELINVEVSSEALGEDDPLRIAVNQIVAHLRKVLAAEPPEQRIITK